MIVAQISDLHITRPGERCMNRFDTNARARDAVAVWSTKLRPRAGQGSWLSVAANYFAGANGIPAAGFAGRGSVRAGDAELQ